MNLADMRPDETFGELAARSTREEVVLMVRSAIAEERAACLRIAEEAAISLRADMNWRGVEAALEIAEAIQKRSSQ